MKKYSFYLTHLLLLTPLLADIFLVLSLTILQRFFTSPYFLASAILTQVILSAIIFGLYIIGNFSSKNAFFLKYRNFYKRFAFSIIFSVIFPLSTLFIAVFLYLVAILQINVFFMRVDSIFSNPLLYKILFIIILVILFHFLKNTKILQLFISTLCIISIAVSIFIICAFVDQLIPHTYGTFRLDDKQGRYIINYDGDYWLTYYTVHGNCEFNSVHKQMCHNELIKTGNTSIMESPIELQHFLEKPVVIKGQFQRSFGITTDKHICIGTGFAKKCIKSPGPGEWYYSPLKISSIQLQK